jgi:hypothetical protein
MKTEDLMKKELAEDFERLHSSVKMLTYSLNQCEKIGIKEEYSLEELDRFETLTARFARTSDIYTQKIMKGIILILREEAKTFIDKVNLFEKLEILDGEEIKLIRDLRNEIAHEYKINDVTELFKDVLEYTRKLLEIIEKTKEFVNKKILYTVPH